MREFKFRAFRAWYKKEKIMLNVIGEVYSECFPYDFTKSKNLVLMQYTGLKDKNGKEIYEGDIIILHNSIYKVLFNEEEARFVLRNDEFELEIPFINENNKRIEIVGNIYENPELLGD